MKAVSRCLLIALLVTGLEALALPPMQHLAQGTVAKIESGQITLVLLRPDKDTPTGFALLEGRTRFHRDGQRTVDERPTVGERVRIYYRNEVGASVATEVAWKTGELPRK